MTYTFIYSKFAQTQKIVIFQIPEHMHLLNILYVYIYTHIHIQEAVHMYN